MQLMKQVLYVWTHEETPMSPDIFKALHILVKNTNGRTEVDHRLVCRELKLHQKQSPKT